MKKRLDILLVEKGLCTGRDKAKGFIMAGQVYVNNQKADKPGMEVDDGSEVELRGNTLRYVSRGGLKLEKALTVFPVRLKNAVCVDIGASTGGFTDCMLQNGAAKVYAIDVGYGQLAWSLRNHPQVTVLERTNIRYVTQQQVPELVDFISIDVSFISLSLVLPVAHSLLKPAGELVCLVKPQFEAGKDKVGKKGVVRDSQVHKEVIEKVIQFADHQNFKLLGLDYSPVKGPEGNIEYLLFLQKNDTPSENSYDKALVDEVVTCSHQALKDKSE